jgi:hypothetical protein
MAGHQPPPQQGRQLWTALKSVAAASTTVVTITRKRTVTAWRTVFLLSQTMANRSEWIWLGETPIESRTFSTSSIIRSEAHRKYSKLP